MTATPETEAQAPDATAGETPRHPSFLTPEMIEQNPALGTAGMFAGDPLFDELVAEIKKERERQRRRDRRQAAK